MGGEERHVVPTRNEDARSGKTILQSTHYIHNVTNKSVFILRRQARSRHLPAQWCAPAERSAHAAGRPASRPREQRRRVAPSKDPTLPTVLALTTTYHLREGLLVGVDLLAQVLLIARLHWLALRNGLGSVGRLLLRALDRFHDLLHPGKVALKHIVSLRTVKQPSTSTVGLLLICGSFAPFGARDRRQSVEAAMTSFNLPSS